MATELRALVLLTDGPDVLYRVVSTGNIWQFGQPDRTQKRTNQDLNLYRLPMDFEDFGGVAVKQLQPK